MRIAIVGHGPSLAQARLGPEIDSHDLIVRMKKSWPLPEDHPELFGTRTDRVVASLKVGYQLIEPWMQRNVSVFWLFDDTRTEGQSITVPEYAFCDHALCKRWRELYRALRPVIQLDKAQTQYLNLSDERGHLHPSAGMHAILYTMAIEEPDEITLYGFDSLLSGRFTWSLTRGTEWMQYPDHNWQAERELLTLMSKYYGYEESEPGKLKYAA